MIKSHISDSKKIKSNSRGFGHHLLLPILAVLLVGSIGAYLTFSSNAATILPAAKRGLVDDGAFASSNVAVPSVVRDYLTGGTKNPYAFAILNGDMRHTVLNVGLRELVTVDPATGETMYLAGSLESRIKNATKWNEVYPKRKITVHVRLNVGGKSPEAWKTLCGTVDMTDPNFGAFARVPRWWVKSDDGSTYLYRDLYSNAMNTLSGAISAINSNEATQNVIGSINIPGAAPNYPEPMLIYAASESTRNSLLAGGFTPEEHRAFMEWLPSTAAIFKDINVELALNTVENIGVDGSILTGDKLLYKSLGETLISKVGSRAVLANYSARASFMSLRSTSGYGELYSWMAAKANGTPRVWAGVQMARPSRVAEGRKPATDNEQWDNVALWAANKGFHFAETTGLGTPKDATIQPSMSNIWPKSYRDDGNDIATIKSLNANFRDNTSPSTTSKSRLKH